MVNTGRFVKLALTAATALTIAVMMYITTHFDAQIRLDRKQFKHIHRPQKQFVASPYVKPNPLPWNPPTPKNLPAPATNLSSRAIIITILERENAEWFQSVLSGWQLVFHTIGHDYAKLRLHAPKTDKGRIANAYLTYLIENYYHLPETVVFIDGVDFEDTTEDTKPSHYRRAVEIRSINTRYVQEVGFANLRCVRESACSEHALELGDPSDYIRTIDVTLPRALDGLFQDEHIPERISTPGGAEFAVSSRQVRNRPVEDYVRFWSWLHNTDMDDDTAGLLFEYLWHIIFGQQGEYCPGFESCSCGLYGKC